MRRAAFFDLDGTLLEGSSERVFIRYLIERKAMGLKGLFRLLPPLRRDLVRAMKGNKLYLKDMDAGYVEALSLRCFRERISPLLSPPVIERVEFHRKRGDLLVLLTGSLEFLAEPVGSHLGIPVVIATRLGRANGSLTGTIQGLHPYGDNKLKLLRELSEREGIDLKGSWAYGNSFSDRKVLKAVGNPVAVNPDPLLWFLARMKGWEIITTREVCHGEKEGPSCNRHAQ